MIRRQKETVESQLAEIKEETLNSPYSSLNRPQPPPIDYTLPHDEPEMEPEIESNCTTPTAASISKEIPVPAQRTLPKSQKIYAYAKKKGSTRYNTGEATPESQ